MIKPLEAKPTRLDILLVSGRLLHCATGWSLVRKSSLVSFKKSVQSISSIKGYIRELLTISSITPFGTWIRTRGKNSNSSLFPSAVK